VAAGKMSSKQSREDQPESKQNSKLVIGWRETISIPEWGITELRAKMDTGARSSAIDVASSEILPEGRVRFEVVLDRKKRDRKRIIEAPISRRTAIRSSTGETRNRLMVLVKVKIGPIVKPVEFSLVCRENMLCRALLGRRALEGDFLIDATRKYSLNS
jgi:hypothetical protein